MKLTDEQIRSMMQKHITCKSLLVTLDLESKTIDAHVNDGWELANRSICGKKIKLTFRKVEKV